MNFLEIAALFWSLPWLCGENMVTSSDDPASSHDSPLSEPCHGDACRYIKILHLPAQKQSHPTIRSARSLIDSRASPRQDDIVCALISNGNAFARGRRGRGSRSVRKVTVRCFPEPVFTNHRQKGEGGGERWWSKKGMMMRKGEKGKKWRGSHENKMSVCFCRACHGWCLEVWSYWTYHFTVFTLPANRPSVSIITDGMIYGLRIQSIATNSKENGWLAEQELREGEHGSW